MAGTNSGHHARQNRRGGGCETAPERGGPAPRKGACHFMRNRAFACGAGAGPGWASILGYPAGPRSHRGGNRGASIHTGGEDRGTGRRHGGGDRSNVAASQRSLGHQELGEAGRTLRPAERWGGGPDNSLGGLGLRSPSTSEVWGCIASVVGVVLGTVGCSPQRG